MNKLERSIQRNAFNEDELLSKIQAKNHELKSYSFFGGKSMKKIVSLTALSFALIFAVWFGFNQNNVITEKPVVMLVGIDINPSFELSVNEDDKVVEIEALNDDAKTITVSDLIDKDVEDVVEEIIKRAEEAGFIDTEDLEEDFVVVSTVSLTDDEDDQDDMEEQLEKKIRDSEYLQSLNIVQVKATQREKFEADGKNIPIGLYVINGYVLQEDGTFLSAKEFFSNPENKDLIRNRSNITVEKQEKLKLRIENVLTELESNGFVGTEYRARLVNATYEQLLQIQAELKVELKNQKKNNDDESDDSDGTEITEPRGNSNVLPKENQNAGNKN
jgi:hypothetical protein